MKQATLVLLVLNEDELRKLVTALDGAIIEREGVLVRAGRKPQEDERHEAFMELLDKVEDALDYVRGYK